MNPLTRFFSRFLGLSALESAVLAHVSSMLPASEAAIFKHQIRQARFRRYFAGGSVIFSFPAGRPVPPLKGRLENATLAVLTVRGRISGFRTTATVRLTNGILSAIHFDPLPWADGGGFEIEGELS